MTTKKRGWKNEQTVKCMLRNLSCALVMEKERSLLEEISLLCSFFTMFTKVEKMSNKKAEICKAAEEKRAMVEGKHGEDILKVKEMASKFRATGNIPKRLFRCFSC
ncbi:hypothetical protein U1Q18_019577 [Sarracenia purpurea var. burkii]